MELFEINNDIIKIAWNNNENYWLSTKSLKIKNILELADNDRPEGMSQNTFLISIGYVPFVSVNDEEVMRAYVKTISNKKLKQMMDLITENYVESFWKYSNAYPELSEGYSSFEDEYVIDKIISWCNNNGIKYVK